MTIEDIDVLQYVNMGYEIYMKPADIKPSELEPSTEIPEEEDNPGGDDKEPVKAPVKSTKGSTTKATKGSK